MASNGSPSAGSVEAALQELADLEKDFAAVDLDAMRQKEYSLRELYARRQISISKIPHFWPTVLTNSPSELRQHFSITTDVPLLDSLLSLNVERHRIVSGSEGDPRSLRFTFTFDKNANPYFEDETVVKEFEYKVFDEDGAGALVSKPVTFKWKKEGRKAGLNKLLDKVHELYEAEQALVGDKAKGNDKEIEIEREEREGLWQYEKLREEMEKVMEADADEVSFLNWFGYRGIVGKPSENEDEDNDEDDEVDFDSGLEVEICPDGEEIAETLAEGVWPEALDFFIQGSSAADDDDDGDEEDSDDDDAPELVEAEDFDGLEEEEQRPTKKQKT